MATYYCSDPHAFHGNIMKYCRRLAFMTPADREAFLALEASGADLRSLRMSDESIDNMNRGLANNINARVGPNDILWCLGDWVFGRGHDYYPTPAGSGIKSSAARSISCGATMTIARSATCSPPLTTRPRSARERSASPSITTRC